MKGGFTIEDGPPAGRRMKWKGGRRKYIIEVRHVRKTKDPESGVIFHLFDKLQKWHLHSRYRTRRDRDRALSSLRKPGKAEQFHSFFMEYRGVDPEQGSGDI